MTQQKRMILIGKTAAGKTTLCQYLTHQDLIYHKTQTIAVMGGQFIDTPGEYLERVRMRGALSVTAADADIILFVQYNNPCIINISCAYIKRVKTFLTTTSS